MSTVSYFFARLHDKEVYVSSNEGQQKTIKRANATMTTLPAGAIPTIKITYIRSRHGCDADCN
jgi:hypothetical protein